MGTWLSPILYGLFVTAILSPVRRGPHRQIWSNPFKAQVLSVHDTYQSSWQQKPLQRFSFGTYSPIGSWRDDSARATARNPTTLLQLGTSRNNQPLSCEKPQKSTLSGRAPYVNTCKQPGQPKAQQWLDKKLHADGSGRKRFSAFKVEVLAHGK